MPEIKMLFTFFILLYSFHIRAFTVDEITAERQDLPTKTFRKILISDHTPYLISDTGLYMFKNMSFSVWNTVNSEITGDYLTDFIFRNGLFYLTSLKGLTTYNGILTFSTYDHQTSGLPDDFLQCICEDPINPGGVLLASRNQLIRFNNETWTVLNPELNLKFITQLCVQNQDVYVLTVDQKIYRLNNDSLTLYSPPWLSDVSVSRIFADPEKLCFCTDHGLIIFDGKQASQELKDFQIICGTVDSSGGLWAGGKGFVLYKNVSWEDLSLKFPALKNHTVTDICVDYIENENLLKAYSLLRSDGMLVFSLYTTEKLNVVSALKTEAVSDFEKKDLDSAEKNARKILEYSPDNLEMLLFLARIHLIRKDYEKYLSVMLPLLSRIDDKKERIMEIASIYEGFDYPELALMLYRRIAQDPQNGAVYEKISELYEKLGFLEDAVSACRKWALFSGQIKPLLKIARLYELTGNFASASETYRSAIRQFPLLESGYLAFARSLLTYQFEDLAQVTDLIESVQKINPSSSESFSHKGYLLLLEGKLSAAEGELIRAVRLDQNNAEAHLNLAELYYVMKKESEMKKELSSGKTLVPGHRRALYLEALILIDSQDWNSAIPLLEEILYKDPYDHVSRFQLARCLHHSGFHSAAILNYRAVLEISPDFSHRSEIESALRLLDK